MKTIALVSVVSVGLLSTVVCAQDSLLGTYSGRVENGRVRGGGSNLDLVIASEENGLVKGAIKNYEIRCGGDYPLEGTRDKDRLELKATKVGRLADCLLTYSLTVNGATLVGKNSDGLPVQFRKR
jgi:hypothetical protein